MPITDINNTQSHHVAVGTTATGFRGPVGATEVFISRGDVEVVVQVADVEVPPHARDLTGSNIAAHAQVVPQGGYSMVPASVANAPEVGTVARRPVIFLQAASAITAASKLCSLRWTQRALG